MDKNLTLDDLNMPVPVEDEYEDAPRDHLNVIAHWEALEIVKAEKLDITRNARPAFIPFAVMMICFYASGKNPLGILLGLIALGAQAVFMILIYRLGHLLCGQVQRYAMLRGLKLFLLWFGRILGFLALPVALVAEIVCLLHPAERSAVGAFGVVAPLPALALAFYCETELWLNCIPDWKAAGIRIRSSGF
jgi:hypothetical protein